jgi:hypothetical protein
MKAERLAANRAVDDGSRPQLHWMCDEYRAGCLPIVAIPALVFVLWTLASVVAVFAEAARIM